jgi:hypothetical protein
MRTFVFIASIVVICAGACAKTIDIPPDDLDGGMTVDTGACTSMCNGQCADLKTDPMNCGKCNTMCPMGATCVQGSCQCPAGQTKCGANCVDTKTDIANCGKCGTICGNDAGAPMGGGMWQCMNGACVVGCPMGKTNCSDACVDTQTDMDNCGMCGNPCDPMLETCSSGLCCKMNEKVCNGMCIDVKGDAKNCGMCGNVCPMNNPVCSNGMCTNIPNGCKVVNGVTWCMDTQTGRSCNTYCTAIGLGNPTITDSNWLNAQNTQALCTQIGTAFGLSFNSISSYTYGCAETSSGTIICSNYAQCPTSHRTQSDGSPWAAICPCK